MFAASEEAAYYWAGRIAIGTAFPVISKNNGDMAEWSIAGSCNLPLKGAVVRIHLAPPNKGRLAERLRQLPAKE